MILSSLFILFFGIFFILVGVRILKTNQNKQRSAKIGIACGIMMIILSVFGFFT